MENRMSRDILKRAMIENLHRVPYVDNGGTIKLHSNTAGNRWCYCESCHALGALDANGRMYGKATTTQCTGIAPVGRTYTKNPSRI